MKFLLHNQCGVFISQAVQTFPYSFLPKFNACTSTLLWLRKHGGESSPRQWMDWERRLSGLNFNGRWEEESPDKIPKPDDLGEKHMWPRIKTAERHELLSGLRPYYNRTEVYPEESEGIRVTWVTMEWKMGDWQAGSVVCKMCIKTIPSRKGRCLLVPQSWVCLRDTSAFILSLLTIHFYFILFYLSWQGGGTPVHARGFHLVVLGGHMQWWG